MPQCCRATYPTLLSKRIKKSASILGDSLSPASTSVALECVEVDMLQAGHVACDGRQLRRASEVMQRREQSQPTESHPSTLQGCIIVG
jgi:hypothetical protein